MPRRTHMPSSWWAILLLSSVACSHDAWTDLSTWLRAHGGTLNENLRQDSTSHSGLLVRGLVTDQDIIAGSIVLEVPQKCFISLDIDIRVGLNTFAEIPSCWNQMDNEKSNKLKLAVILARETRNGTGSFFYPYLKNLPSVQEFEVFHPFHMGASLLTEFSGLPIVRNTLHQRKDEDSVRRCFESWVDIGREQSSVFGLSWEEVALALMQVSTYAFQNSGRPELVPGADRLNTETPGMANAFPASRSGGHPGTKATFKVRAGRRGVRAGEELTLPYARRQHKPFDNDEMMNNWGVYLETNEATVSRKADCQSDLRNEHDGISIRSMRQATEEALLIDDSIFWPFHWRSPRCREEVLFEEQGFLRCSLARLAWEHCAGTWRQQTQWRPLIAACLLNLKTLYFAVPLFTPSLIAEATSVATICFFLWPCVVTYKVWKEPGIVKDVKILDIITQFVVLGLFHCYCYELPLPGVPLYLIFAQVACFVGLFVVAQRCVAVVDQGQLANGVVKSWTIVGLSVSVRHFIATSQAARTTDFLGYGVAGSIVLMAGAPLMSPTLLVSEDSYAALRQARCGLGCICSGLWTLTVSLESSASPLMLMTTGASLILCILQMLRYCLAAVRQKSKTQ